MAKLVIGVLIGLVLGLYLDSSVDAGGASILMQLATALRNLVQF